MLEKTEEVCASLGISYAAMTPVQRLFVTHYRCHKCKMLPLFNLDMTFPRRAKCGSCGDHVTFKNNGKYGKIRKTVALMMK